MPVPTSIDDLSTIAIENSPQGTEPAKGTIDDYFRRHAGFIAELRDRATPDSTLRTDLAATTGPGLLGWLRAGIGAVTSTLAKWMGWQEPTVFEFMTAAQVADVQAGAALVDVTAACQAALTAYNTVRFPDGAYLITAPLVLKSNQTVKFGANAALRAGANNISLIKASTATQVILESPAFSNNGKTGVNAIEYSAMQTGCRINQVTLFGPFARGIWLKQNCYGVVIDKPQAFQCPNPIEFGYSVNGNTIIGAELNNLTAVGGSGGGIGINFNDATCNANVVIGGYIQGYTTCYHDKGEANSIAGTIYFEHGSDSHIFLNGARQAKINATFHYGDGTNSGIKARNSEGCTVTLPTMVDGPLVLGLWDVDGSNVNFKATTNSSFGYNTKFGTVAGVNFTQEDSGTATLAVVGSTTAGTASYLYNKLAYKRVGKICYFSGAIVWTGHTGTGDVNITGLPYPADANYNLALVNVNLSGPTVSADMVGGYLINATPTMNIQKALTGVLSNVPISGGGTLQVSGFYFVA